MTTQKRIASALATALAITAAIIGVALATSSTGEADWTRGYEPCATEDAAGPCYYDSTAHNPDEPLGYTLRFRSEMGRSFVVEADGQVIYVDDVQPEHADLCTEDEILAYAPERPGAPICVHIEGDGARFFPSEVTVGK